MFEVENIVKLLESVGKLRLAKLEWIARVGDDSLPEVEAVINWEDCLDDDYLQLF
jgi:hypothetical protein